MADYDDGYANPTYNILSIAFIQHFTIKNSLIRCSYLVRIQSEIFRAEFPFQ